MKVSHELQRDKLNSKGLPPVRLAVSWEGQSLRLGTGYLMSPAHWDAKTRLVKVQPGTQHSTSTSALRAGSAADENAKIICNQWLLLSKMVR